MCEKLCRKCGTVKRLEEFGKDRHRTSGYTSACKKCRNIQAAKWQHENRDRVKELNRANREKRQEYYSDPSRKAKYRNLDLIRKFRIEQRDYELLLTRQKGVCAICGEVKITKGKFYMPLDHCHTTGKIRGILCPDCNIGLGCFKDSMLLLELAIEYLKRAK